MISIIARQEFFYPERANILKCIFNFSHGRKPRSNFRRPSSLGLAATPVASKTESKSNYQAKPATRTHIVAPLKVMKANRYFSHSLKFIKRNTSYIRPTKLNMFLIFIQDHLRPEGAFEKTSEAKQNYRDHSPGRPVIHKLKDHLKVSIFEIKMLRKPQYDSMLSVVRFFILEYVLYVLIEFFISMFLMYMNVLYLV